MDNLWQRVNVRAFNHADIDMHLDYWHNPSNTFLDVLGVDRNRLAAAHKMKEQLLYVLDKMPHKCTLVTIEIDGKAIGVHEITDIASDASAVMHANIWSNEYRGKGIGKVSYIKAMQWYFDHFALQRILFKTPKTNVGANKLKQFLGIKKLSECKYELPIFKQPLDAYLYEVSKSYFDANKNSMIDKLSERAYG